MGDRSRRTHAQRREPPEGELDAGDCDESREGISEVHVVLGEAAIAAEPGKGRFDDPAARQDDESWSVVGAFDNLDAQRRLLGDRELGLASVVAAIGPDEFEPLEALADAVNDQGGAIPVLDGGGMNNHRKGKPSASTRACALRPFTVLLAS
jgi:hypothetical protein